MAETPAKYAVGQRVYLGNWLTDYRHGDRYGDIVWISENLVTVQFEDGRTRRYPYGDLLIEKPEENDGYLDHHMR